MPEITEQPEIKPRPKLELALTPAAPIRRHGSDHLTAGRPLLIETTDVYPPSVWYPDGSDFDPDKEAQWLVAAFNASLPASTVEALTTKLAALYPRHARKGLGE